MKTTTANPYYDQLLSIDKQHLAHTPNNSEDKSQTGK